MARFLNEPFFIKTLTRDSFIFFYFSIIHNLFLATYFLFLCYNLDQ